MTAKDKTPQLAFTLIELLVVIAIVALLAGMIFPITGAVNRTKMRAKARAELAQIESAIENYKSKVGHYPPGNPDTNRPNWYAFSPLLFELGGTVLDQQQGVLRTLDGSGQIAPNRIAAVFGLSSFVNTGASTDESAGAQKFLTGLKPNQIGVLAPGLQPREQVICCSIPWPVENAYQPLGVAGLNPVCYNVTAPVNNKGGFDLWIDIIIGGKTNRICNWSREPLIVSRPY